MAQFRYAGLMPAYDYDRGGSDPSFAFLFLHGLGSVRSGEKATLLRRRASELGVSFLAFDARGHGETGGPFRNFTVSSYLEDAVGMLEEPLAGVDRVVVVGSSLGGLVALHLAARRPDRTRGVVAIAPALRIGQRWLAALGQGEAEAWRKRGYLRVRNEWMDLEVGIAFLDDALLFRTEELDEQLRVPALIIHGAQDASVPPTASTEFALRFPRPTVDLLLLGRGDHRLNAEKERVQAAIEDFAEREAGLRRPGGEARNSGRVADKVEGSLTPSEPSTKPAP